MCLYGSSVVKHRCQKIETEIEAVAEGLNTCALSIEMTNM